MEVTDGSGSLDPSGKVRFQVSGTRRTQSTLTAETAGLAGRGPVPRDNLVIRPASGVRRTPKVRQNEMDPLAGTHCYPDKQIGPSGPKKTRLPILSESYSPGKGPKDKSQKLLNHKKIKKKNLKISIII